MMVTPVVKVVREKRKMNRIYEICQDVGVHGKKMKAVKGVIMIEDIRKGQKGFGIWYLGHLMKLCLSDGLWVRNKTLILSGTWKGCDGSFIGFAPPDQRVPPHLLF
ncbi:hypothetical protein ACLOJK_019169 [Asimina triloba]